MSMPDNTRKPSIRFQGFVDTWEQCKLGDIAEFNPNSILPEVFEYVDLESVLGTEMISHKTQERVTAPSRAQRLAKAGDLFYQMVRPYQKNNYLFKKPYKNYVFSTGYAQLRPTIDGEYLLSLVQTEPFVKAVLNRSTGTSYPAINATDLSDIDINIPVENNESRKIGTLFNSIDNLITLHQRKYDKLVNIKKSMLEKMFPRNGSKVPEIRFNGFSDAWEQRKVTEIGEIYIGLVTTMTKHYTNSGTLLIRNSDIKDSRFEFSNNPIYLDKTFAEENATRMHQIGDVITVHTGDVGTSAVITEKEANSIGFATIVTRPDKAKIDSNYLSIFLNTDMHKKWAIAISTGDGRTNYNLGDYFNLSIPMPKLLEQQTIAKYFNNLNCLITLHQRKVEKLKNIKKSCLEKMFV
jgi:type I restriction enzyme S subunit